MNDTNAHNVDPAAREAARAMLWKATLDLGLRQPGEVPTFRVEWKRRAEIDGADGQARGLTDRILMADDLTPEAAAVTMAHEVRHMWQYETGMCPRAWFLITPEIDRQTEADAYAYEAVAMRSFTPPAAAPTPHPMDSTVKALTAILETLKTMNGK